MFCFCLFYIPFCLLFCSPVHIYLFCSSLSLISILLYYFWCCFIFLFLCLFFSSLCIPFLWWLIWYTLITIQHVYMFFVLCNGLGCWVLFLHQGEPVRCLWWMRSVFCPTCRGLACPSGSAPFPVPGGHGTLLVPLLTQVCLKHVGGVVSRDVIPP